MTRTYNDIDAVTRLLEEKERDLELAARIGQSLLDQNKDLRIRNEQLEQELASSNESVIQLKHDLAVKNGLLQIYVQDFDTESEADSPIREKGFINWEVLNKKITTLQEENSVLRTAAISRTNDIEKEEKKEIQLITDCVRELNEAHHQIAFLQEDIGRKSDDTIRQQEEITQLLSQVVDLQRKLRDIVADNECLSSKLEVAEECQHELSEELIEMKEKYGELIAAFQELQADVKQAQHNSLPCASFGLYSNYLNPDCLASELEHSLGHESDGYSSDGKACQSRKVLDTVRYAHQRLPSSSQLSSSHSLYTMCTGRALTSSCFSSLSQLSSLSSGFNDILSDGESADADSSHAEGDGLDMYAGSNANRGRPTDLNIGLAALSSGFASDLQSTSEGTPVCLGNWVSNFKTTFCADVKKRYQLPEKLQIIKPMEGSQTLQHWQRLATPHLGGIFESHPGVKIRGVANLKNLFGLEDYEEDEGDDLCNPGKSFMPTCSVYTFTTSTLQKRSSSFTNVTPSYPLPQVTTRVTSHPPSALNSPQQKSSVQSLAKLLTERNIYAILERTPAACVAGELRKEISPTPTPAPSPEGSPPSTPIPFTGVRIPDLVGSASFAKGFHLLKKRRSRSQPPVTNFSRDPSPCVNLDLMGRISRIGVEKLISSGCISSTSSSNRSDVGLETLVDKVPFTVTEEESKTLEQKIVSTSDIEQLSSDIVKQKPCGFPPPVAIVKSPTAIGLTPTVPLPLSRMPNPVLQLNSLRSLRPNSPEIGTVGALRTLRKGGYI